MPTYSVPYRTLIIDNIEDRLQALMAAGSDVDYPVVVTVERVVKAWDRIGVQAMPWVGMMVEGEEFGHHIASNIQQATLRVAIVAHINAATQADRTYDAAYMQASIIRTLLRDPTRGGYASNTILVSAESDESDPDAVDSKGGQGTIIVRFDIVYYRNLFESDY